MAAPGKTPPRPGSGLPGRQSGEHSSTAARLVAAARELDAARTPADVLELIVGLAPRVIPEVSHASITVSGPLGLATAAATDHVPRRIDSIQYELGEGPCVTATRTRQTVFVPAVKRDRRWPTFSSRLENENGIRSMIALPLGTGTAFEGSLNLAAAATAFTPSHAATAHVFARTASQALTRALDQQTAAELAARVRELEDFTAALSHDLRNGVGAALTAAEALARRQRQLDRSGREALRLLTDELRWQARLLLDLLDLARARDTAAKPVPVLPIVRDVVQHHEVAVRADPAADRALVAIKPVRLRQILQNLLTNAGRHGGGATGVQVVRTGDTVAIAVEDAGRGVPAEQRERVFERFRTASTDAPRSGTGLGLALSREHARSAGGDLVIESRDGPGARFVLRLPVADQPVTNALADTLPTSRPSEDTQ